MKRGTAVLLGYLIGSIYGVVIVKYIIPSDDLFPALLSMFFVGVLLVPLMGGGES